MYSIDTHNKVLPTHLKRRAFLYIRQSSLKQVMENTESTERQYNLKNKAISLGWDIEEINIIDEDLGKSGASAIDRDGFNKLVSEVGLGRAGIVMGIEVSRLARNSSDWHKLLEICALTDTLILDEDGIYNPGHFNDRLLLGMKGTMSEAELHVLNARLRGGILNKASKGELTLKLPTGLIYDAQKKVVFDPDIQVKDTIKLIFTTFKRTGSARGVLKHFRINNLNFPKKVASIPNKGEIIWKPLTNARILSILHNPRYAGAFVYGRKGSKKLIDSKTKHFNKPINEWTYLIKDIHPGYISWKTYQDNLKTLEENCTDYSEKKRRNPPREGPALIQGLVICGICGEHMTVNYYTRNKNTHPNYVCQKDRIRNGSSLCQFVTGKYIDDVIEKVILESVTLLNIKSAIKVEEKLAERIDEVNALKNKELERARYDADMAQMRYMKVDPRNRLVADSLEADWNLKLKNYQKINEKIKDEKEKSINKVSMAKQSELIELAKSFPKFWKEIKSNNKNRKKVIRFVIKDVTLKKTDKIYIGIRFKGGEIKETTLPLPENNFVAWTTDSRIVKEIDRLLDTHTQKEIAERFNKLGWKTGKGKEFTSIRIERIRSMYKLRNKEKRWKESGWLTRPEIAAILKVSVTTITLMANKGILKTKNYNAKKRLYADPSTYTIKG